MIIVRDVFRIKYGKTGEAVTLWKYALEVIQNLGHDKGARMLTDLIGPDYYTLILETPYESLTAFERSMNEVMSNEDFRKIYNKIIPLCEGGHREVLKVI